MEAGSSDEKRTQMLRVRDSLFGDKTHSGAVRILGTLGSDKEHVTACVSK